MPSAHKKRKKKSNLLFYLFLLFLSVPLTLALASQQQQTRSNAAATTSLSFQPDSSTINPIRKNVGDPVDLDMYIDPGTNFVTFVKYKVNFDSTKLKPASQDPFSINLQLLSNIEGPIVTNNSISQALAITTDSTKAIRTKTKIGTLHFIAIGGTSGETPTTVTFNAQSQVLSAGVYDGSLQNVLATATPATITINGGNSPTPEATASKTAVKLTLLLHGVGKGGDNSNPSSNSLSNKDPKHPQRLLTLQVINSNNETVSETHTPLNYNKDQGTFESSVNLPTVPTGNYTLKVKTDRYLRRTVPDAVQITADHTTNVPSLELVAGDTNGDNSLDILDYNALLDCGYGEVNPKTNGDQTSLFKSSTCQIHTPADNVDIDDNNVINSVDYNLFLRELSVQNGD